MTDRRAPDPILIADYVRGDWLLTLVCCGREDGFQVCPTNAAAEEFRAAYLDAQGHDRVAILSRLDQTTRVGFHEVKP